MKVVVLLSAGRHPVSGRPALPRVEAQAIRLALDLGGEVIGLHAGPEAHTVSQAFGYGLGRLIHLPLPEDGDPVARLAACVQGEGAALVLAGARSQGGEETGLVPYALAHALGWPLISEAIGVAADPGAGRLMIDQALPRGARRRFTLSGPAAATVSARARPPLGFAHGRLAGGQLDVRPVATDAGEPAAPLAVIETPHRRRPKLIAKAATGGERRLMLHPSPEEAASAILDYLGGIGMGPRSGAGEA
jgi:N,N-dimethylglycine/sarcosine catabolism electron transfer flavoprotein subunit beta